MVKDLADMTAHLGKLRGGGNNNNDRHGGGKDRGGGERGGGGRHQSAGPRGSLGVSGASGIGKGNCVHLWFSCFLVDVSLSIKKNVLFSLFITSI